MNKSPQAASVASAVNLEKQALTYFSTSRYKEAAELYKDLLKRSDKAFYRQQLAQCYLQRALGMSAKGMAKEAVVLWENYADWAEPPLAAVDSYILWQLAAKNTQKALARLEQLTARELEENYSELAIWLGFLVVSGHSEITKHLPPDSAFLVHFGWIREALDAYRNHHTADCEQALQKLPFRSVFRDLRTLLKAQLASAVSFEQAQILLSKIPEHSPYRPLADALLAYTQDGARFVESVLDLEHNQRRIVARGKGLSSKQIELLESLYKLQGHQTDKTRFNLAIQYRALFGIEAAQAYCQGMLASYPAGNKDYLKHFDAKDIFEQNRIQALLCEKGRNSYDALFFWERCIEALKIKRPENDKKIALILRHMSSKAPLKKAIKLIIDSLEYDPLDRDSHLKILGFYDLNEPEPAEYERWLELSLTRFPKDIDLLVRAAKSASAKKAFKKAAKYAQALLKIDPVNTLAKQLLFASHLAHARRLIKTEKFHLVEKEIEAAEQLTVDKSLRRQADLMRGFFVFIAEDKKQGLQHITEALQSLNADPVNAQFQAVIESSLMDVPVATITKPLLPIKDQLLSEQQLTRLMALIKQYDEQISDPKLLFKALDKVKAPVKKSIQQQPYSEDLLLAWCQVLEAIQHFELLKHCAKQARAKWQTPIWIYYQVYSESLGNPDKLGFMGMFTLQNALEDARVNNDQKAVFLISRFIQRAIGFQDPFGSDFDDEDDDEFYDSDIDAIIDDLFGHVPESVMAKMNQKLQAMMLKTSPEKLLDDMIKKYRHKLDPKKLASLFMNPEFYTAVAMLNAAEELRIDIGLCFEDIVDFFEDSAPQLSFPFF